MSKLNGWIIGADSMGAIAPTAKKVWGQCPQVAPPRKLVISSFLKE